MGTRIDLKDKKFGRLTVIDYAYTKNKRAYWYCKCDCGNPNIIIAMGKTLKSGGTKSCGCLNSELMAIIKPNITRNNYIIKNNYIVLEIININKNVIKEVLIDIDDYTKVNQYTWWINNNNYAISQNKDKIIFLHKYILGDTNDFNNVGDHINGDTLNNRKYNLRKSTTQTNGYNNKKYKNNSSGVTGVWFNKRNNKWCAEIKYEKYKYFLLESYDKNITIKYREIAELYLFGEYSRRYDELKEKYKNINIKDFIELNIPKIFNKKQVNLLE